MKLIRQFDPGGTSARSDTFIVATMTGPAVVVSHEYLTDLAESNEPAVISYTDDHNDYDGHTYVTRQISGPSIKNEGTTSVPPPVEGANLPPRMSPPADGSQVTDFAQDVQVGLLGVVPLNDPLDICIGNATRRVCNGTIRESLHATSSSSSRLRMTGASG